VNTDDIRGLYAYDHWANRRVVAAARLLPAEEFTRDLKTSFGSVRGTLVHILEQKCFWLQLWQGQSLEDVVGREPEWAQARFADVASVEARWSDAEHEVQIFLEGLTDERLKTRMAFQFFPGQPWEFSLAHLMQHVVNHSSYHRGQVVTLLRQLGHAPPATDFLEFLRESAEVVAG
jgi:uncharacterized damage-inducible protein DinB